MQYLILIDGGGGGCDYTIGCNKTWRFIEADSIADAEEQVKDIVDEYGSPSDRAAPDKITIVPAEVTTDFDVAGYRAKRRRKADEVAGQDAKKKRREQFDKLKEEFGHE